DTLLKVPYGLATASLKRVVGTPDFLLSLNYYDIEGKMVQTIAQNYFKDKKHLNNFDMSTTQYHFSGAVSKTKSIQSVYRTTPLVTKIENENVFDHQDRLLAIHQ